MVARLLAVSCSTRPKSTPADRVSWRFRSARSSAFGRAYEAAAARGCLVVPGGGMNTLARLELIRTSQATVVFCTPSYALHMAEVAAERQIDVAALAGPHA